MQFLPNGAMELLSASDYDNIGVRERQLFGHMSARYSFPTKELIVWLRSQIGDRRVIEIGSGSGDLCYHLGIRGCDNYQQTFPDVKAYYEACHQPTIKYGSWVEQIDAISAIRKYRPEIVIGSWITHWIDPTLPVPVGGGNVYGVHEHELLELVDMYILIGNLKTHQYKPDYTRSSGACFIGIVV